MKDSNSIKFLLNSSYSLNISADIEAEQILLKSLYAYVITALETFLSDTFINAVLVNSKFFRRFIEINKNFKKEKFSLSTIFEKLDRLDKEVKEYLSKILWHDLKKVENIYKLTLEISFPDEYKDLLRAVRTRHDIVHRSGKKCNGEKVELSSKIVSQLMNDACIFVDHIDSRIKPSN